MSKTFPFIALAAGALLAAPALADSPGAGETRGFHPKILAALADFGHLSELAGKYKLRVTQVTIDPDGGMGAHHHAGPGIRCLTSGELTYTIEGKTTVYRAGDCFTETGGISHTTLNAGAAPVVLLNFEILPASLPETKGSLTPLPK